MELKQKKNYRELRTETEYLKNLAASLVNRFGDSVDAIAFTWMVYALTGSAALTATTYGVNILVSVLLQPFTAALITNMRKKPILILTDVGRGVLVVLISILYFLGALQPWMLIISTGLMSTLEAFRLPAGMAIMPKILAKEKYTLATSLSAALSRTMEIIGMALAGPIISLLGVGGALIIDGVTFFASAAILVTLRLPPHERSVADNAFREFAKNTKEGFVYVWSQLHIRYLCIAGCLLNLSFVPFSSLQTAYVNESLSLGAEALSVIGIASSLGTAIGSIIFPKLADRIVRFWLFFWGVLAGALTYIGFAGVAFIPAEVWKWAGLIAVSFATGFFISFANNSVHVSLMQNTDESFLARVSSIMSSLLMAAMPAGSFAIALFAGHFQVTTLFFASSVLAAVISLSFLFMKPLRDL